MDKLFIVKSILKIIIHVLKLLQKNFECCTLNPSVHGTFCNLYIKMNLKIHISETNGSIEFKFCTLSTERSEQVQTGIMGISLCTADAVAAGNWQRTIMVYNQPHFLNYFTNCSTFQLYCRWCWNCPPQLSNHFWRLFKNFP